MAEGLRKEDFKVMEELGRGSFGVVYKVKYRGDNLFYVLKTVSLTSLTAAKQKEALQEVTILRKVDHPHIVRYYASFIEDNTLHILLEYIDGGDLHRAVRTQRERHRLFSETKLWRLAYELTLAVQYLHSCRIIHRDIKPLNVMLTKDGRVKLGDLGVSRFVMGTDVLRNSRVGTPLFLAPELVRQDTYDFKVDIWALGCVIYTLAQQDTPFKGENLVTLGQNIVEQTPKLLPRPYSAKFSDFVDRLMTKKVSDRPDIRQVLEAIPLSVRQAYVPPVRLQPPFRLLVQFPLISEAETRPLPLIETHVKSSEDASTVKLPPASKPPLPTPPSQSTKRDPSKLSSAQQKRSDDSKAQESRPGTSSTMKRHRSLLFQCHAEVLPGDCTPANKLPASRNDLPLIYARDLQASIKRKLTIKDLTLM